MAGPWTWAPVCQSGLSSLGPYVLGLGARFVFGPKPRNLSKYMANPVWNLRAPICNWPWGPRLPAALGIRASRPLKFLRGFGQG